ncbi:MAG: serine hydrolase family protein [Flavobacteriales bacterium]|nr:serine hydrolase family protein [Flavobacteriales bacterium]
MKINIPGLHNSGKDHWQTLWELEFPGEFVRVQQADWDHPHCQDWIEQMENSLSAHPHHELILIGHSIGCMAIVKWFERYRHTIKGALLVAPSDSERENYPEYISGFVPIPTFSLPFPTIVVGSTNDHVTSIERTGEFAKNWGSRLVMLEDAGHIEPKSGFGPWLEGLEWVRQLEK